MTPSRFPIEASVSFVSANSSCTPGNAEEVHTRYRARNRRDVPRLMLPSGTTKCNQVIKDANFVSILQEAKCELDFSVD